MTKRVDLGVWIAGLSGAVIAGAVVAGLFAAGNPADVRAERIDALRLSIMREIATAAQCAYTYTGEVPTDLAAVESALREHRRAAPACDHVGLAVGGESVSYAANPPDQIELCADFQRPSPEALTDGQAVSVRPDFGIVVAGTDFPELREPRPRAGQHCYRVRLIDQAPVAQ